MMKLCSSCSSRELLRVSTARQTTDGSFVTVSRKIVCEKCDHVMTSSDLPDEITSKPNRKS